jgi:hypothetical protein
LKSKQEQAFFLSFSLSLALLGVARSAAAKAEEKKKKSLRRQQTTTKTRIESAALLCDVGSKRSELATRSARARRCAGYATGSANTEDAGLHNTLYSSRLAERKKNRRLVWKPPQEVAAAAYLRGGGRLCFNDVFMILIKLNSIN